MKVSLLLTFLFLTFASQTYAWFLGPQPMPSAKMVKASQIARERSLPHSSGYCWRYVKTALVASGAVSSYPKSNFACEAGRELVQKYGFTKLRVRSPWHAPVGSVLVYAASRRSRAGHVEIRGKNDFISDYRGRRPAAFRFLGAYALVSAPSL